MGGGGGNIAMGRVARMPGSRRLKKGPKKMG